MALELINNSSSLNKENHKRNGGLENPILIRIDFDDYISSFTQSVSNDQFS